MNERAKRAERLLALPMLVAALLVIPVVVIEQSSAREAWQDAAAVANWLIWIAFALEAAIMLVLVDDRLKWVRSHPLEVAIVVLTPPFLPASLQALRAFRLLRLLRLLRAAQLARRTFSLSGLRYASFFVVLTALATVSGRLLAMGLMLVGIGFIAILTGAIAERFLASQLEQSQEEVVTEVEESGAELHEELRAIRERLQLLEQRLAAKAPG